MIIQLVLGIVFLFLLWNAFKKPADYPPGLWGFPVIGYIPIFKNYLQHLNELRKKHGDVILWRLGSRPMVFLYNFDTIKEVLNRNDFVDRPPMQILGMFVKDGEGNENTGIVTSNGAHWHSIRRFSLRLMRDLGMGKSRMVSAVHHEANCLVETLRKRGDTPAPLPQFINIAVLNVIWQMVASKRYDIDDPVIIKYEHLIREYQASIIQMSIADFFQVFENLLPRFLYRKIVKYDQVQETRGHFHQFLLEYVIDHKKTLNPDDPRDYIDSYLIEMERQKDNPESNMSEKDLIVVLFDLFAAGSETVAAALKWSSYYLATYPEVQKKIQKNIDEQMPSGSLPTLEDRPRLAYVEAFIHEIHRYTSFAHLGVMHTTPQDTNIGEHFIPKGTILNYMVGDCHHDPRYWENPNEFNPGRFLDEEGKFQLNQKGFLPFGIGKRSCMGEALARVELLIFLTALVQHFTFSPPAGKTIDLNPMPDVPFFKFPNINQDIVISSRS